MITKILQYLGLRPKKPLTKRSELVEFIHRNASFVSQVTLLTYIKARAGTQYPKLFENTEYLESIEIARSHLYTSCVADLVFYVIKFISVLIPFSVSCRTYFIPFYRIFFIPFTIKNMHITIWYYYVTLNSF